jgi:hypothetical protein
MVSGAPHAGFAEFLDAVVVQILPDEIADACGRGVVSR